jgi:hypothetical protein
MHGVVLTRQSSARSTVPPDGESGRESDDAEAGEREQPRRTVAGPGQSIEFDATSDEGSPRAEKDGCASLVPVHCRVGLPEPPSV